MWIFLVHFISSFRPSLFRFWSDFPTALFLNGVSGKFATATLAVILGYLAYSKGMQNQQLSLLIIKRYLSFLVMGIFVNVIYTIHNNQSIFEPSSLKEILFTSIKIGSQIFPTFWCMKSFFWGSVMSYINGKYTHSLSAIFAQILMLMFTHNTWIAICLLGNVLYRIADQNIAHNTFQKNMSKPVVQIILILIAFSIIKRPESDLTFFIDGISSVLILAIISYNPKVQKVLCNDVFSYFGKHSMGIFLLHPVLYDRTGRLIFSIWPDTKITFLVAFIASVSITVLASILVVRLINYVTDIFVKAFIFLINKTDTLVKQISVHH